MRSHWLSIASSSSIALPLWGDQGGTTSCLVHPSWQDKYCTCRHQWEMTLNSLPSPSSDDEENPFTVIQIEKPQQQQSQVVHVMYVDVQSKQAHTTQLFRKN